MAFNSNDSGSISSNSSSAPSSRDDDTAIQTESVDMPSIIISDTQSVENVIKKKKVQKVASHVPRNERSFLYRGSSRVVGAIEYVCGLWGSMVAVSPWKSIMICLLLAALSGSGLYNLKFEFRPYKLWVKEPSEFKEVHEWKMVNFPNNIRKHIAIWEMDNILTADAIKQMWALHQKVAQFRTSKGFSYSDVCLKVPSLVSTGSPSKEESYDYENYDYTHDVKAPVWLTGNDNASTEKNSYKLDSKIASSRAEPEYPNYDYDEIEPLIPAAGAPKWLESASENITAVSDQTLAASHYLTVEEAYKKERKEHCDFVEDLDLICYEESLLEVWGYNDALIQSLTDKQVIDDINNSRSSRVTGFPKNITAYLGGVTTGDDGLVIAAKGALHVWYTRVNMTTLRECEKTGCKIEIDLGSGEEVDEKSFEWEIYLSNVVDGLKSLGMPVNLQASYQFGAIHKSALFQDIMWVLSGWGVLVVYVLITLGKPFTSKSQAIPTIVGIICVGLGVMASYGVCTLSGIPYGPLNSVLPVLLIALGVDDMYVILNAWDSLENSMDATNTVIRMKKTLRHAGLAITVTSLTDVIAFVIGATTDVPALKYFCVYAAVGITYVYFLQVTLFVASVVLNHKYKKDSGDEKNKSCLPSFCCKKDLNEIPKASILSRALGQWVKFLLKPPVMTIVLMVTGFVLGAAFCQAMGLKQRFESVWLLPKSSDLYRWFTTMDEIFPKDGREGFIFFENVNFPEELPELQKLTLRLESLPYVSRVDAWYDKLVKFMNKEAAFKGKELAKEQFYQALSYFMFNEEGAKYRNDIIFDNGTELLCNQPAPLFKTFKINFQYIRLEHTNMEMRQNAMKEVRDIVANASLSGYKAPWALSYGQWETENVISKELFRNIILVLVIVFVMTMILLASIRAALLVLVCVLATLVDVCALMYLWGLTINTVSCIALVLAIGICVDYAAHITHGFLVSQGSRKFRAESAMRHMGPAVMHGGMSTLLAFMLLAPSDTFVFISYFKILTGVAVFGLYHALVLLPILLALLGPPPYPDQAIVAKPTSEDSHSCTTDSTSFPCTPSSITPAITPQSTTPNSPTSLRASPPSRPSFESQNKGHNSLPSKISKAPQEQRTIKEEDENLPQSSVFGSQAIKNIKLTESLSQDKVHKEVANTTNEPTTKPTENTSLSPNFVRRDFNSSIRQTDIKKENVLKLYIKNS